MKPEIVVVHDVFVNCFNSTYQFSEPWNWSNHSKVILTYSAQVAIDEHAAGACT